MDGMVTNCRCDRNGEGMGAKKVRAACGAPSRHHCLGRAGPRWTPSAALVGSQGAAHGTRSHSLPCPLPFPYNPHPSDGAGMHRQQYARECSPYGVKTSPGRFQLLLSSSVHLCGSPVLQHWLAPPPTPHPLPLPLPLPAGARWPCPPTPSTAPQPTRTAAPAPPRCRPSPGPTPRASPARPTAACWTCSTHSGRSSGRSVGARKWNAGDTPNVPCGRADYHSAFRATGCCPVGGQARRTEEQGPFGVGLLVYGRTVGGCTGCREVGVHRWGVPRRGTVGVWGHAVGGAAACVVR